VKWGCKEKEKKAKRRDAEDAEKRGIELRVDV
jgi:hypothetical protein